MNSEKKKLKTKSICIVTTSMRQASAVTRVSIISWYPNVLRIWICHDEVVAMNGGAQIYSERRAIPKKNVMKNQ